MGEEIKKLREQLKKPAPSPVQPSSSQAEAQVKELLPLIRRHVHPEHYQKTLKDPELRKLLVPVHGKLAGRAILCTIRV